MQISMRVMLLWTQSKILTYINSPTYIYIYIRSNKQICKCIDKSQYIALVHMCVIVLPSATMSCISDVYLTILILSTHTVVHTMIIRFYFIYLYDWTYHSFFLFQNMYTTHDIHITFQFHYNYVISFPPSLPTSLPIYLQGTYRSLLDPKDHTSKLLKLILVLK